MAGKDHSWMYRPEEGGPLVEHKFPVLPEQCMYPHDKYNRYIPSYVGKKNGDLVVFCGACGKEYSYYGNQN